MFEGNISSLLSSLLSRVFEEKCLTKDNLQSDIYYGALYSLSFHAQDTFGTPTWRRRSRSSTVCPFPSVWSAELSARSKRTFLPRPYFLTRRFASPCHPFAHVTRRRATFVSSSSRLTTTRSTTQFATTTFHPIPTFTVER